MAESIESVMRKHERRLLGLPNVTGVGIGEKSGRQVILVFVSKKVPESGLGPKERVPKTLDGFETDVEVELSVGGHRSPVAGHGGDDDSTLGR